MKKSTEKKATRAKTPAKTGAKRPYHRHAKAEKATNAKDVTFTVHAAEGKNAFLAGEFNGWDPAALKMAYKSADGIYAVTIKLAPGTYQYKFVIDGTWCADPENVNAVPNDQGTFNSVITVQ